MRPAIFYLVAIVGAEVVTNFVHLVPGIIFHTIILIGLIVHSSLTVKSASRNFLLALCLAPLIRIVSLSMPFTGFQLIYWYLIIYPILFLAAWVTQRRLNFTAGEIGINTQKLPLQFAIGLTGIIFGLAEYYMLRPEPIISQLTWGQVWLPAFVLLVCTGFVEEFIFRGVIQRASMIALGRWGLVYVALLFAALHLIHWENNPWDILLVFLIGLFFGWVVNKTGSLNGVSVSHGITNVILYLVAPFFLS